MRLVTSDVDAPICTGPTSVQNPASPKFPADVAANGTYARSRLKRAPSIDGFIHRRRSFSSFHGSSRPIQVSERPMMLSAIRWCGMGSFEKN